MKIDAKGFEKVAKNILAPIYPVIAQNIIRDTGICRGVCIDLGAGPGNLGLELAKLSTELSVILFDQSDDMLRIAGKNCADMLLGDRVKTRRGNVECMPFSDNFADLIVSRGSIFFWEDQPKAINEAYRVLKPGGCAYIGGGFGSEELYNQVRAKMLEQNPDWDNERKKRIGEDGYAKFAELMKMTRVTAYEINRKQAGLWIVFRK